ncbi:aminotransferase class V-fold PLP-dependent enzyme [Robinsoniella sp. KNHs210]|uniref:aminotransferase class V-fold PLP-dependent enzyme n=1 Tax=Robinsoniella sp. KNHs210 TaxID=1469950 RepID=UPI000480BE52|nr:cysteine desulfurase [Robinsoniella sp. KNHs210]
MKHNYRDDFPILQNKELIYLDSAATSQKPRQVMDAMTRFYEAENANPMRGLYGLSIRATETYERARHTIKEFIGARHDCEIIFTRNTTESINLAAYSYGLSNITKGDEIVVTIMEHHSNLLPWQMVAKQTGAKLIFLYCSENGSIPWSEVQTKIGSRTKLVGIAHVSNVIGCTNPVREIITYAHKMGAVVLVDGAQAVPHMAVDVQDLDADFYAFSGHKLLGPMGIGVLYGKKQLLEEMPPFLTGGEMIDTVSQQDASFAPLPHKFEAGTVNAQGAAGLEAAVCYLKEVGYEEIQKQEEILVERAMEGIRRIPHVHLIGSGNPKEHSGILTFTIDGVHPHDIASIMDSAHIAIRAGHHCAEPLMKFLNVNATARASVYFYNTEEEIDIFLENLRQVRRWLGYGA